LKSIAAKQPAKEELKIEQVEQILQAKQIISMKQSPQKQSANNYGATYESYFEIDKPLNLVPPDESCSLKDLFSQRANTKKRSYDEITACPKTTENKKAMIACDKEPSEEERIDNWITNKKKRPAYKKR